MDNAAIFQISKRLHKRCHDATSRKPTVTTQFDSHTLLSGGQISKSRDPAGRRLYTEAETNSRNYVHLYIEVIILSA